MTDETYVYLGDALGRYGFGGGHPFSPQRYTVFKQAFEDKGLVARCHVEAPVAADAKQIERFHTHDYVQRVQAQSRDGIGWLDYGDTPAYKGVYEAAAVVVGTTLDAMRRIMIGKCKRAFVPIAGLHHAARDAAAGFCVFNDCGVAIESLQSEYDLKRVAYIDIDAHHGDGVFYAFEDNPGVLIADLHQDGRTLYPGTGFASETGKGRAKGTKLNIPMPPGADDNLFMSAWERVEQFLHVHQPEFILLQCGVDSIRGDPITAMAYSPRAHAHAAERLREIADSYSEGRLLATGGG
ncbi:MAG TPA: acetoin utilization protein AcuC, partial [Gammaproteobacteria bacterium]|nr:acetoin utilization protein AcuC [Gammaproteobacteria bacterium]